MYTQTDIDLIRYGTKPQTYIFDKNNYIGVDLELNYQDIYLGYSYDFKPENNNFLN